MELFDIASQSQPGLVYRVLFDNSEQKWFCGCESFQFHGSPCKHILIAQKTLKYRERAEMLAVHELGLGIECVRGDPIDEIPNLVAQNNLGFVDWETKKE